MAATSAGEVSTAERRRFVERLWGAWSSATRSSGSPARWKGPSASAFARSKGTGTRPRSRSARNRAAACGSSRRSWRRRRRSSGPWTKRSGGWRVRPSAWSGGARSTSWPPSKAWNSWEGSGAARIRRLRAIPLLPLLGGTEFVVWRLDRKDHALAWDSGEGAFRVGGRWNGKGVRAVHRSLDPSTAILEVAVHKGSRALDTVPHALTSATIADPTSVHVVHPAPVRTRTGWRQASPGPGSRPSRTGGSRCTSSSRSQHGLHPGLEPGLRRPARRRGLRAQIARSVRAGHEAPSARRAGAVRARRALRGDAPGAARRRPRRYSAAAAGGAKPPPAALLRASATAVAPAKRPNTAPLMRPEPPG